MGTEFINRNRQKICSGPGGILLLLLILLCPLNAIGQNDEADRYSFDFRGESLEKVLDTIAKNTNSDLVYDPKLITGIHVYKRVNDLPFPFFLKSILEEHGLDYILLSTGTYVVVENVEEKPLPGSLIGKVTDRETGKPLPGATVYLADASGGTSTGRAGNFSIPKLISGTYNVIFSYVGYEPVYKTIEIKPGTEVRETVTMQTKPVDVAPVIVEAHRRRLPNQGNNDASVNAATPWQTVTMTRDPIRSLNLTPGIQYGLPMTGLHLEGGQNSEHRLMLDGVPVYNPFSFGQLFSAFSPFAIENVNLHKSGFGVQEGSQIAGIVDLNHQLSFTEENSGMIQSDPVSANAKGNFYIPTGEKGINIMTAVRTNLWDIFEEPNLRQSLREWDFIDPLITNQLEDIEGDASLYRPSDQRSDVQFFDYHLAAAYETGEYSKLQGSLYLAENSITTELLSEAPPQSDVPRFLNARDSYSWKNRAAHITWSGFISPRFDLSAKASFSSSTFDHRYQFENTNQPLFFESAFQNDGSSVAEGLGRQLPTQIDGNRITHFTVNSDSRYSLSPSFQIDSGIQLEIVNSDVDITDLFFLSANTDQSSTILSSYLNATKTFDKNWLLSAGTRFTYLDTEKNSVFAEPRASIQYDQPDSGIGFWSARISGGIYRQFINQHEITNVAPTAVVPSFTIWSHSGTTDIPKAYHLSGSFLLEPSEKTVIKVDAFYKWQPKTNITSYTNLSRGIGINRSQVNAFAESTSMESFGFGLRVNHSLADSKLQLMAGYDYSSVRIDYSTQFGRTLSAPWNEPHRAQFRTLWNISRELTVLGKWQGIRGRAWAFRQSYYNFLLFRDQEAFSFSNPEDDKLKPFQQVDLSFIYQPVFGETGLEFRLELINILNRRNTIDQSLLPSQDSGQERFEVRERTLPGFYPSASVQFKF